ncbi:hypothetical protein B0H13DRAFT_2384175 [Mycena leptocephala]|nr:hypothetical protein B0H13DRAFT_2384175 [Mycena leptocephala]
MHRGGAQRSRSNSQYPDFDDRYGPSLSTGEHMEHDGVGQFRTSQGPQRQYRVQETPDFDGPAYPTHLRNNRSMSGSGRSEADSVPHFQEHGHRRHYGAVGHGLAAQPMSRSYSMNSLYEAPRFPSSNAMHAEDTSLEQRNAELEAIVAGKPPGGSSNRGGLGARGSILQQKRKATRRLARTLPELDEDTAAEAVLPGGAQTSDDAQPSDDDALDDARSDDP